MAARAGGMLLMAAAFVTVAALFGFCALVLAGRIDDDAEDRQ